MSTTKSKIINNILNIVSGGVISDDIKISKRQISFLIDNTRAALIRQDLNKNRSVSQNISQTISCIPVEKVDASLCCNIQTECYVMRSVERIPKPIELNSKDLINKVSGVSIGEKGFSIVPIERIPYIGKSGIPGIDKDVRACYFDGYIFLFDPTQTLNIKRINVTGVFANPADVAQFNNCEGKACYDEQVDNYPISEHMLGPLTQIIISEALKIMTQMPIDDKNDANNKPEPNVMK